MKITAEKFWEILWGGEAFAFKDWKTKHNSEDGLITPKRFDEALRALNQVLEDPKERFLEISLQMEKHSRGLIFSEAMAAFPSKLFHEWCDLAKKIENSQPIPQYTDFRGTEALRNERMAKDAG